MFSPVRALVCSSFLFATGCGFLGLELNDATVEQDSDDDGDRNGEGGRSGKGGRSGDGDGDANSSGDGDGDGNSSGDGEGGAANGSGGASASGGARGTGGVTGNRGIWDNALEPCSTGCREPLLLYRSFEDDLPPGAKVDEGATLRLTQRIMHSGQYSLATTQGDPETDAQITEYIDPVLFESLYYRAWIYVPEGAISDWIKVVAFNGQASGTDVNLLSNGAVEIYSQISGESAQSAAERTPASEWFCLQVHIYVDNVVGQVEVSVNEKQMIAATDWDTRPGSSINNIVYGIAETGSKQTGATIYTDDIVASAEPVPCSPLISD